MKNPRFKGKIRVRLFCIIALVLAVFLVIINVGSYPVLYAAFTSSTYKDMCSVADTVKKMIPDTGTYYIDLYSLSENHNVELELVDTDGNLIYTTEGAGAALSSAHFGSTGATAPQYDDMVASPNSSKALNYDNFEVKLKQATSVDFFIYTCSLSDGSVLHIYSSVADVESVVTTADRVYTASGIVMILLVAIIIAVVLYRFTRPIEKINDVTRDMAALKFDRKCSDYGNDEIGELGRSINTLSDSLDAALVDLKEKNARLEKDIELRTALDNARKSFISNVSHELKTPIAIISGYAEGLCTGVINDPESIKEYCGIINDESHRMNELVLEILELSRLESKSSPFDPDYFEIGEAVSSITEHLQLQAMKKGITIENNVPKSLECYAQGDKIGIVLNNYITNGISHCSGENRITVSYRDMGSTLRLTVFNTGSHIADEDMPEIWDSFYRADKAHGRSENRFGLGLSIVKSIMEKHGCAYGAENAPNGVEFYFEVAKNQDYYEEQKA